MRRRLRSRPGTARARPGLGKGVADDTDSERAPMTVKASLGPSARENGLWSSPCGADTHRHWSSRLKLVRAAQRDSERERMARRGTAWIARPPPSGPLSELPLSLALARLSSPAVKISEKQPIARDSEGEPVCPVLWSHIPWPYPARASNSFS